MNGTSNDTIPTQFGAVFFVDVIGHSIIISLSLLCMLAIAVLQCLKKQPVMYKNFMHLVLLARILSSVFQMVPSIVGSRCLYFPFGVLTVNFTSSFIYLVVAAQVFVTKRIQDLKQALFQDAIKSDSATIQVPVSIKVLKFVTSKWVAIALYLVFIGAIVGIHLLLYFVVARQSCQEFTMYIRVSVVIVSALLLSMIILVLLLDLYESREDCFQLKCWKLYTHDDPLVYRTELTLIIMLIPFLVVLSLIVTNVPAIPTELGTSSVKLLADFLSFIFIPGVSFFATIWSECKLARASKMKRESRKSLTFFNPSEETIRMLLADPVLAKHFIAFAKREFSVENILFFESVQQFKAKPTYENAKKIYNMYLDPYAVLECNITDGTKQSVLFALKQYETAQTPIPTTIFAACETAVIDNMLDSYRRFWVSGLLKEYAADKV